MESFEALREGIIDHLKRYALSTDGPFQLSSGGTSDWYLDGRQTTFSGEGGRLVGRCVGRMMDQGATAIGGLTMGADPVAVSVALLANRPLKAFSIRKQTKTHGTGGRLVGPVGRGDKVVVVDDTTTTGASLVEAVEVLRGEGIEVVQAIVVVDRSHGAAAAGVEAVGVPFAAVVGPEDLGLTG